MPCNNLKVCHIVRLLLFSSSSSLDLNQQGFATVALSPDGTYLEVTLQVQGLTCISRPPPHLSCLQPHPTRQPFLCSCLRPSMGRTMQHKRWFVAFAKVTSAVDLWKGCSWCCSSCYIECSQFVSGSEVTHTLSFHIHLSLLLFFALSRLLSQVISSSTAFEVVEMQSMEQ